MNSSFSRLVQWACLLGAAGVVGFASADSALEAYVRAPDPAYRYELVDTKPSGSGTAYVLRMVSQSWLTPDEVNRTEWWHWVVVHRPASVETDVALLFIGGGSNREGRGVKLQETTARIAEATRSVVVELQQVPNQPLIFHGDGEERVEDNLIAYGWARQLRGDRDEWLTRLPMTKSAVRAMDTVSDFLRRKENGGMDINRYVVAGGSKRGWTTWTTAVVDQRVVGIAPIVIDMLNVVPSFKHHWEVYGFYAPAVRDYVHHGVMDWQETEAYQDLIRIVEPFEYREQLTLPKLMINATGDQFFLPDSHRFYFDQMKGPTYVRYIPNADHSLDDTDAVETLAAWHYAITRKKALPRFQWKVDWDSGVIDATVVDQPKAIRLWQASNTEARDFRLETIGKVWTESEVNVEENGRIRATVERPKRGWTAFLVEFIYEIEGAPTPLKLTTGVAVVPDIKPFAGQRPPATPGP